MTLTLEKTTQRKIQKLEEIFKECMEKFPELKDETYKLKVVKTSEKLEGAKGTTVDGQKVIVLWIPDKIWGHWEAVKPIIYHELSHCIDLHNPDKVFFERADKRSIELWKRLQEAKALNCEVVNNG